MRTQPALIFIPTYNEAENAALLFEEIKKLRLPADVVFMDDNSPDGTGAIIDGLAEINPQLTALHRTGKLGIGSAHQEGIKYAYSLGYETLITLDCDFTHQPENIPELLNNNEGYEVIITSRYMLKGSLAGWNLMRKTLTHLGHLFTGIFLNMSFDATGSFRLYKINKIPYEAFSLVSSKGYSFFYESLYILNLNGCRIKEIPIKLSPRTYGSSKMRFKDAWDSFFLLVEIYLRSKFNRKKFLIADSVIRKNKI